MIRTSAIALSLLLTLSCAKGAVGEDCTQASECADGTSCVLLGSREIVDGGPACNDRKKRCSITCGQDADCAALGTGFICLKDCFMGSCLKGSH